MVRAVVMKMGYDMEEDVLRETLKVRFACSPRLGNGERYKCIRGMVCRRLWGLCM